MTSAKTLKTMSPEDFAVLGAPHVAYLREMTGAELRAAGLLPEAVAAPDDAIFITIRGADGRPLAVMDDRDAALRAMAEHDLLPVTVH